MNYRARVDRAQTLKSALRHVGRGSHEVRYIQALRDVTFDVKHGEFLGVIGHNGAGKSTLLRTIAGILPPSKGRVVVTGYVATLLSVGIGFNGELTGRENIRLGGLANGLSPYEVAEREDQIAEFSGLGEFVDYPLKTYSSGMRSRLGFAVAVNMEPDILLIDEALSAGDAQFRTKATEKIEEIMEKARAIVLVSHGLATVEEMATSVLWLDHGRVMGLGEPAELVAKYKEYVQAGSSPAVDEDN